MFEEVIARWTGIPVTSLKEEETHKLLRIELELHERVVSQRPAISALARAISPIARGLEESAAAGGLVSFSGTHGRGQDRGGAFTGRRFCLAANAP